MLFCEIGTFFMLTKENVIIKRMLRLSDLKFLFLRIK